MNEITNDDINVLDQFLTDNTLSSGARKEIEDALQSMKNLKEEQDAPDEFRSDVISFMIEGFTDTGVEKERMIVFRQKANGEYKTVEEIFESDKGEGAAFFAKRIAQITKGLKTVLVER